MDHSDAALVELLRVRDHFALAGCGVLLVPDFPVPEAGWRDLTHPVVVVRPDGGRSEIPAEFRLSHALIRRADGIPSDRWRVVVRLPAGAEETVPVGSRLLVPPTLLATLAPTPGT